SGDALGTIA
ncbi:hypothetical protein MKD33_07270, partial [Chromobacterium piscinae]